MLLIPHIRIANRVRQVMEQRFGDRLNPLAFTLGSVAPDLYKRTETGYHDTAETLCQIRRYRMKTPANRWRSSFRQGMLCHFAADSFCRPHIEGQRCPLRRHIAYEVKQCRRLKRGLGQAQRRALDAPYSVGYQAIDQFLQQQRQFAENPQNQLRETEYALQGCVAALRSLED